MKSQDLFESFDAVSDEQWHTAIERFLKGKPLEHLHWEVENGVTISPLQRAPKTPPPTLGWESAKGGNQWYLSEAIVIENAEAIPVSNKKILDTLTRGADALLIQWKYLPTTAELDTLFQGVLLDLIQLHFDASNLAPKDIITVIGHWSAASNTTGSCTLRSMPPKELWPLLEPVAQQLSWRWLNFSINPSNKQSLTDALYAASLWFDFLLEKQYTVAQIIRWMRFDYAIEARYFVALARLRAFKRCWLALLKGYETTTITWPWIHASTVNDKEADQYRNMLVGTTQAMASVIAGVDSLWIRPSNGLENANDFTSRIARNVQHLLQAESYFNRVIDPAAGAYYIEHLTATLTQQAWQQFCTL